MMYYNSIIMHLLMIHNYQPYLPNEEVDDSVSVCSRCMTFIKEGKIPPFATINNKYAC